MALDALIVLQIRIKTGGFDKLPVFSVLHFLAMDMARMLCIAALGGALLGIGSRITELWPLSLIGFVPLMVVMARVTTRRTTFLAFFGAGIVVYGLSLHALFWDALPLEWIGLPGTLGPLFVACLWGLSVIVFAGTFAGFMTIARVLYTDSWRDIFLVSACFVLAEWVGAWLFYLINYTPTVLPGPHFTMGSPAYQFAADPVLVQVAIVGGVYALAFVQAAIGVTVYRAWRIYGTREGGILIGVLLSIAVIWGVGTWWMQTQPAPRDGEAVRVGLVTYYGTSVRTLDDTYLHERFNAIADQLAAIDSSTDIVALPEDTRFLVQWRDVNGMTTQPTLPDAVIIESAARREADGNLYSRTEYFNTETGYSTYAYKEYLMIFGEYLPYIYRWFGYALGQHELVAEFLDIRGFKLRGERDPVVLNDGVSVSARLCSEAMSPTLYAKDARKDAEVFLNLASHSWFHGSRTLYTLAKWNGIVRAVENRRWYARTSNATPSFIIDPYGRTVAETMWDEPGVLQDMVYTRNDITPFTLFGQWVLLVPVCIIGVLWRRKLVVRRWK